MAAGAVRTPLALRLGCGPGDARELPLAKLVEALLEQLSHSLPLLKHLVLQRERSNGWGERSGCKWCAGDTAMSKRRK